VVVGALVFLVAVLKVLKAAVVLLGSREEASATS
jgi:hypothetical protein